MPDDQPDGGRRAGAWQAWLWFGTLFVAVAALALVLDNFGWSKFEIYGAIIAASVIFGVAKFAVSWVRAGPVERQRWSYRGHHDGGSGPGATTDQWHGTHRDD